MLSYRHGYHAGNTGDVLKHLVLSALLRAARRKTTPLCYVETHAGAGVYDLTDSFALRNREYETGIGALWQRLGEDGCGAQVGDNDVVREAVRRHHLPTLLADYRAAIVQLNADPSLAAVAGAAGSNTIAPLRYYPGSPSLARHWLDASDPMWLAELHPADYQLLTELFASRAAAHVRKTDGYQLLKSVLPAGERRAVVLIDPAYERDGEQARIVGAVANLLQRMRHAVCAIWAPLRGKVDAEQLAQEITALRPDQLLRVTLRADDDRVLGSSMLVVNPPFRIDVELREAMAWLVLALPHSRVDVSWLIGASAPAP